MSDQVRGGLWTLAVMVCLGAATLLVVKGGWQTRLLLICVGSGWLAGKLWSAP